MLMSYGSGNRPTVQFLLGSVAPYQDIGRMIEFAVLKGDKVLRGGVGPGTNVARGCLGAWEFNWVSSFKVWRDIVEDRS